MAERTKQSGAAGGQAGDRRNEDQLAGFRIGLAPADRGRGRALRRADRVDVFDGAGEPILSCRVADLREEVQ